MLRDLVTLRPAIAALLLAACGAPEPAPLGGPMDFHPARRTRSPSGRLEVQVGEDQVLRLQPAGQPEQARVVDQGADPRVALDEARLVYARDGGLVETDLWMVELPDGEPVRLTDWLGTEDRPVLSPDDRRVAFISGRTGIASWWVADLDGPLPIPVETARQLTNVGLERDRRPGVAPLGFQPPPDGTQYAWTEQGLSWVAGGQRYTVAVPPSASPPSAPQPAVTP